MSSEPNLDFGVPVIFFDSHPEEQESYLYSYWSSLKSSFHIAFTGQVPKFHSPGTLRLIWYTHDKTQGLKDYELHEYALVREHFDVLLNLDEVRRAVIMGYSGQNPYILGAGGRNPWADKFERQKRARASQEEIKRRDKEKRQRMDSSREGRTGVLVDIEDVLERSERAEQDRIRVEDERRRTELEKQWGENDGLLSEAMV